MIYVGVLPYPVDQSLIKTCRLNPILCIYLFKAFRPYNLYDRYDSSGSLCFRISAQVDV